ncbi:hypothetical protein GIB67_032545 [Kingdonia uniflora]|uniref:Glucose-methanol-choline oxidoreductase N-terminal domain-containing protein n=1 Tax=Kingdonia uniflora TaxID=39325 RepID=A0A7J7L7N8_9MAGN|nr:hypothetical protein GIB67_032545 [Kingdonia uniflora]
MGYQLEKENLIKPKKERPIQKEIVETSYESDTILVNSLAEKGLKVIEDRKLNVFKIECDVVIVGSCCEGRVTAVVLANSRQKVVVVEKGHYFVVEYYSSLEGPSLNQLYESGGVLPTLDGKCMMLVGSTVGGGSVVNWSASIKAPTSLLKKWALDHKIIFFGSSEYVSAMDTVSGDKRGANITWLVDAINNAVVILTGCKAERFILEKNHSVRLRRKKCVGLITPICSNKNITKRLEIKDKEMISTSGSLLMPSLMLSSRNIDKPPGKTFQGGIITTLHKISSHESESNVETIIEAPTLGQTSFGALLPWVSGHDTKKRLLKYLRTAHLFVLVKDQGALQILVAARATEAGIHKSYGQRMMYKGVKEKKLEEFLDSLIPCGGPKSNGELWNIYCSTHQMGSCRMGATEEDGRVDENAGEEHPLNPDSCNWTAVAHGSIQLSGVAPEGFYRIIVDEVIRDDVQLFMEGGTLGMLLLRMTTFSFISFKLLLKMRAIIGILHVSAHRAATLILVLLLESSIEIYIHHRLLENLGTSLTGLELQRFEDLFYLISSFSMEMPTPVLVPPTYQGMSDDEAAEAKIPSPDPLYLFQLYGGGGYRRGGDGSGGGMRIMEICFCTSIASLR